MADLETSSWSETAASNNTATPNGWPEGMLPSDVNNCARENMAALKRDWNRHNPTVTSGGSANVQTLTYTTAPSAYVQGQTFCFIAGFTNTGAATLNVNALGAKSIFLDGVALGGGEIVAGQVIEVAYDNTQFQIISGRPSTALPNGTKNLLVNGDMEIWQRGAGGSASIAVAASTTAYTADRWYITTAANEACVISQQAGLTNQSRFCARVQRNSGQTGTGAIVFGQPIDSDILFALRGQTVTVSVKWRSGANWSPTSGNVSMTLYAGTGSVGKRAAGFTSETNVGSVTAALGTSSAVTTSKFTSAAVFPTTATQGELQFAFTPTGTAGAADYVEIDEVQIEIGGVVTSFDRRMFVDELARCQKFYYKTFTYSAAPAQSVAGGAFRYNAIRAGALGENSNTILLRTRMFAAPTVTFFNPQAANAQVRDITGTVDCSATTTGVVTEDSMVITCTGNASTAVANTLFVQFTAEAEI